MTVANLLEAAKVIKSGDAHSRMELLMPHIKTADGKEVVAEGDALDRFLATMDDKDEWRTVLDPVSGDRVKLTGEELDIIRRIQAREFGDAQFEEHQPYVDFFTGTLQVIPINLAPEPKRRFRQSKWEAMKVAKLVKAIRKGLIVPRSSQAAKQEVPKAWFDLWAGEAPTGIAEHIAAPKLQLPEHAESYNPPEEYLLTAEEEAAWRATDPEDRQRDYLPQKLDAMRKVPGYQRFIQERFSRCLDLYMCPRALKNKIQMRPEELLPVLPDPRDLKPFPTSRAVEFVGHADGSIVGSVSVDPTGQWLVSCASDNTVRLWDVQTGRCLQVWETGSERAAWVAWNPNRAWVCFAVAVGADVWLVVPSAIPMGTDAILETLANGPLVPAGGAKTVIAWAQGGRHPDVRLVIPHAQPVAQVRWHRRGDYFASVAPAASAGEHQRAVVTVHQLSTQQSQWPFQKMAGTVRAVAFHPAAPHFVVATSKAVRIYDLVGQKLVRKMVPGLGNGSLTSLDIHPQGDHLLVGSHDAKTLWYDLDAASKPYRTLQSHQAAVRSVAYHRAAFPLFASASDDGTVQVVHGQVFQDLMQDPVIVPVKILRGFPGPVTQVEFHPVQPWLFCASAHTITLFVS